MVRKIWVKVAATPETWAMVDAIAKRKGRPAEDVAGDAIAHAVAKELKRIITADRMLCEAARRGK